MYDPLGILTETKPEQKKQVVDPLGILPEVKKKEGGVLNGTGKVGQSQLSKTIDEEDDPVKAVLTPVKNQYKNAAGRYIILNKNEAFHSEQQYQKPILTDRGELIPSSKELAGQEFIKAKQNADKAAHDLIVTRNTISDNAFPNGVAAKNYLANKLSKKGKLNPDNETEQLAQQKSKEYDDVAGQVLTSQSITAAAINDKLKNDPEFAKKYNELKSDGIDLPNAVEGQIVASYIYKNGRNLQALADQHPNEVKDDYEDLKTNLVNKYPDFGISVVANKISQEREKLGYNNAVANFHTNTFDKHNDEIASKILTPQEKQIWDTNKDDVTSNIDTGGFVNRIGEGIEGGLENTKNLFKRVTGQSSEGERISEEMNKQATGVTSGEKGWKKSFGTAGDFLGIVGYMATGGRVTEGLGANPIVADKITTGLTFGEQMMREGEMKYPDNDAKALLSGVTNTAAFMALSPFKAGKVSEALSKISPEIEGAIKTIPENATAQTTKEALVDAFQKGMSNYGKGIVDMGALTLFNQGLDKALGGEDHPEGELAQTLEKMAIGGLIPSAIVGAGRFAETSQTKAEGEKQTPEESIIDLANGNKLGGYSDLVKQNPQAASEVLTEYAKQKYGLQNDGTDIEGGGREIPKEIDKVVIEKFPDKQSAIDEIKSKETTLIGEPQSAPLEKPKIRVTADQLEQAQPPKQGSISDELPFGESDKTGIAHDIQEERTFDTKSLPPERGEGVSVEDAIKHGQDLLKDGKDPDRAAADFKKDNKISFDALSLVRAKHEKLVRETNKAIDDFGENSKQAKEATEKENKWYNDVVKPMQTEWHKIGQAQQGQVDIDTGSYVGLSRAFRQNSGRELTPKENREARELSWKVKKLSNQVEDLKQKLTNALDKNAGGESEAKLSFEERAKRAADKFREKLKTKPFTFKDENGNEIDIQKMGIGWNDLVEIGAKAIELSGKIVDGVKAVIDKIKDEEWYKKLSDSDKDKFEEQLTEHYGVQDITTQFVDKKDNKFTPADAKTIWDYAKSQYLDKGEDFNKMISGVSIDLGLKPEQVRDAIVTPKGTKPIADAMYKKQNERNMAIQQARDWAKASKKSALSKFFGAIPRFFFAAKVFGHGTVGMVTHSGINVYDPIEWKRYWPIFFKQFKFAYGKTANYEKAMQDLQNDPQFIFWKRNGLAVDPTARYDEYQFVTNMFNKMGVLGKWLSAGDRGFNALKVYRLERAKALWKDLSNVEKADPNTPKEIAKLVNHSTGTTNLKVSETASVAFFAPNLELARWNKLIVDPVKAVKTFTNWNNASPSQKAAAKIVAKRAGRIMATYLGALAVNQGLLSLSGSNQKINLTDPTSSDWLKFKSGGRTIDLTGGMVSLLGFLTRMAHTAIESSKEIKNKSRKDELMNQTWSYVSGKASPFASTAKDVVTHHDFQGNTLPMFDDKPLHSWNKKLTWPEYLKLQQTPIPVAEAFTDIDKQMEDEGVKRPTINNIMQAIFIGGMVGGTGVHIGEEPKSRPSQFTDEDKKDPTFKYFIDKGMELPNTQLQSEVVKDEKTLTKKKVTDYPEETQKLYSDTHKEILKQELEKVKKKGYVYINPYGEVSINHAPKSKRTNIDDLDDKQLAEVLHISQSQATTEAKKKVFYKKH
jgi:hypothetical protein